MKTYQGITNESGCLVQIKDGNVTHELPLKLDVRKLTDDGFSWGEIDARSAQLSLALLCDALQDDEKALQSYQAYMFEIISKLPKNDSWELTELQIHAGFELASSRRYFY